MSNKIFVAGHRGMVGSAICRKLDNSSESVELITARHEELDLTNQTAVLNYLKQNSIDQIYLAAAKVGGIHANDTYPAEFIYENLMIEANVIHAAHLCDIDKLLFLGSSCIYPRMAAQPMEESALLTGVLEPTNEPYAIAKIAGIKICESYNRQYGRDYRSAMPTNLYGPNDNFHAEDSHVIPALIRRFHDAILNNADEIVIWGTGAPKREFLHVDDMAAACVYIMNLDPGIYRANTHPMLSHINVGTGHDISIRELAETLIDIAGFRGKLIYDSSRPDGSPRKLMKVDRLRLLGWQYQIKLEDGLRSANQWYVDNLNEIKLRG